MSAPSLTLRWLMPIVSVGCALCGLHAAGLIGATVCRAETDTNTASPAGETTVSPESAGEPIAAEASGNAAKDADRDAKRQAASIGLLGLMGILLTGVGLLVLVILWGHRLRRITRSPSPSATLGDELWYLRPDKQKPSAGPSPSDEADDGRHPPQ